MIQRKLFYVGFALLASSTALAANSGISYEGQILKPDGTPLQGQFAQFKLQIRTPDTSNCLMYEEVQSIDLRNSGGNFALTLNDGTGSRTDATGLTIDRIFANQGSLTFNAATCSSGSTYAPSVGDGRRLVVLFKDETMAQWEPIPDEKINYSPLAIEAKQIAGFGADSLLRVTNATGDPIGGLTPLSNAQYTELIALVNGTSSNFTKANQLAGTALPSMVAGQVLGWNGLAWVSQTAAGGSNSVTTTMIQSGAIDSTRIANSAVGTSQISNSVSINTSGTLGSAVSTTRDFKLYAASPSTYSIDMQAPALSASYNLVLPMNAGGSGQVLSTNGSGTLSWQSLPQASQWSSGVSSINYMGGNVGIGTTNPSYPLYVQGAAFVSNDMHAQYFVASTSTVTQPALVLGSSSNGIYGDNNFVGISVANIERMHMDATGKVGVGTTAPQAPLDVNGYISTAATTTTVTAVTCSGAGTMSTNSNNTRGGVSVSAASSQCAITFAPAFNTIPYCVVSYSSSTAPTGTLYAPAVSAGSLTIKDSNGTIPSGAMLTYICIQ